MKVYNGEGMILGRLATYVAKEALLGEEVRVVNCEKVIISGDKFNTFVRERARRLRKGYPLTSQVRTRLPDRFVRRAIRGMLPWKKARGKETFKRVMCYVGVPAEMASEKLITIESASKTKLPTLKYVTVGEVLKQIGGK